MDRISALLNSLNRHEQWVFSIGALAIIIGCVGIGTIALSHVTETVPTTGGTYTEGLVGYPAVPNPVLATTTTDQTLVKLVYSGILRKNSWNNYAPDLGSCAIDANPGMLRCTISPGMRFHDGTAITADDVLFTFETAQKIGDRSPIYSSVVGVTITKEDDRTVLFSLPKPFTGFQETLTTGILPKHIWKDVSVTDIESQSTLADMLVGSGPYEIIDQISSADHINTTVLRGIATSGAAPYISKIVLKYYADTDEVIRSFNKKTIDAFVLESKNTNLISEIKHNYTRIPIIHPDIYGVFTRSTLSAEQILLQKLEPLLKSVDIANYGFPWSKPLPPWDSADLLANHANNGMITRIDSSVPSVKSDDPKTLVTVDEDSLVSLGNTTLQLLSDIEPRIELRVFDFSSFKNSIIPKRSFDFLIFGQRYRHVSDAFAYWNSGERNDPGLNITETVNKTIDDHTSSIARGSLTRSESKLSYSNLNTAVEQQSLFLPLYLNRDIYIFQNRKIPFSEILLYNPTVDRMNAVRNWYINTSLKFKNNIWQN